VSRQDIEDYFSEIATWMQSDSRRDIRLAQAARGEHRELPLGELTPERARATGALTLFAIPARRLALVARRGRAA